MPTPNAVSMVRSALQRAMSNLGGRNGHAIPAEAGNHDSVLHELYVASEGRAYFDKRYASAKSKVREHVIEVEDSDTIAAVEQGTEQVLLSGSLYDLVVKCNNAPMKLDMNTLRIRIEDKFDIDINADAWTALLASSKLPGTPARTIKAVGKAVS